MLSYALFAIGILCCTVSLLISGAPVGAVIFGVVGQFATYLATIREMRGVGTHMRK